MASMQTQQKTDLLMDQEWARIQKKTFTKWVNSKLVARPKVPQVEEFVLDLHDGIRLIHLLEIIGNANLGRFNANPKMQIHKVENLNKALEFIQSRGVQLVNIGAPEIADRNEKLLLGLIWSIILRFTIADISEEGFKAKEGLLLWCQRKTKGYKNVDVQDFTQSWQDGLAFCALINKHRPELIDFDALNKENRLSNLNRAFDVAERRLGIPRILDAEDLANIARPDERSVMTYVASYFHAFSNLDKAETAGRRVGKFSATAQSLWEMQHDYEERARRLLQTIRTQINEWTSLNFTGTYADAKDKFIEFNEYKAGMRRTWVAEKQDLYTLFNNIQTKLAVYNMQAYVPPKGLAPIDIENQWKELVKNENAKKKEIAERLRAIRESIRHEFADQANALARSLDQIAQSTASLTGGLEQQIAQVEKLTKTLIAMERQVEQLQEVDNRSQAANIIDNEHTSYTYEDISYEYGLLLDLLKRKHIFLENQVVVKKQTNLTPQQLEEFEQSFRFFDRDNSNSLKFVQFKDCLESLGKDYSDADAQEIFKHVGGGDPITFEKFLEFMISITADRATPMQIIEAFRQLAGGKKFITQEDMRIGQLQADEIEYLMRVMPRTAAGFDYESLLETHFV